MRCIPLASREAGSAVVGFSMVAPLMIAVFIAVLNVGSILSVRAVLSSAAQTGARVAGNYGATRAQGVSAAQQVLESRHLDSATLDVQPIISNGLRFIVVTANYTTHVAWLNRDIQLSAVARSLDENGL
ncbi:MAG: TadE/TadG family type IV pilus assembly protein [Actinomycetes bacterium]